MKKPAALANPRLWGPRPRQHARVPRFFVMSDMVRLPKPEVVFDQVPKGSAVILRHTDPKKLAELAADILPKARARGLKVLISNDVRLAHRVGADGVHLSEAHWRQGHWRRTLSYRKPNFLITIASHGCAVLKSGACDLVDGVMVSPVFPTQSHPDTPTLGHLKFTMLAKLSPHRLIALGGITDQTVRHLKSCGVYGIAAIGAWCTQKP